MSEDLSRRRAHRREQNRLAAQRCRQRRQETIQRLMQVRIRLSPACHRRRNRLDAWRRVGQVLHGFWVGLKFSTSAHCPIHFSVPPGACAPAAAAALELSRVLYAEFEVWC